MTDTRATRLFTAACVAASALLFLRPLFNPDLFWHLTAGRRILETGAIPRADWLSFTMPGAPWLDFEWLTQLIWRAALAAGGFWGLLALKAATLSAAAYGLWRTLKLYSPRPENAALALLAWSVASIANNDLRPDNFTLLFFMLEWWLLEARRLDRGPSMKIWVVVPMCALWANLHPGFLFGLVLLGIYAVAEAFRRRSYALAGWTAAAAAATLMNPFGIGLYRVIVEHARQMSGLEALVNEWMAPTLSNPWMLPFWLILFAAFAAILRRYLKDRKVPAEHLLALGFFALAASRHNRFSLYFNALGVSLAVCHAAGPKREGARWAALLSVWAGLMAYGAIWIAPDYSTGRAFVPQYVPDRVVAYLRGEQETLGGHRWAAPLHWGGYMSYELSPRYPTFIDGRYIFYPLLIEMTEARASAESYRAFLDRYAIDIVADRLSEDSLELLPKEAWALVDWNLRGAVFVRRSAFPRAWLEREEFRLLRPFDDAATERSVRGKAAAWARLSAEMDRFAALSPGAASIPAQRAWVEGLRPANGVLYDAEPGKEARRK